MMNIKSAIGQMRVARRLGKLSSEQSARLLRRLGHPYAVAKAAEVKAEFLAPPSSEWLSIMALRNAIEADVSPVLEAARRADEILNSPAKRYTMMEACLELETEVSGKVTAPALVGHEFTPQWWKEAEIRERAKKRAEYADN